MFAATKSRSASSSTMQASFPPNSIWRGIMPAFFEIATPVSPPVKLSKATKLVRDDQLYTIQGKGEIFLVWKKMNWIHLIQCTPGCIVRKSPISEPFPVTQLIRPLGKPAKWKQCTIWRAETAPWKEVKGEIKRLKQFRRIIKKYIYIYK